MHMQPHRTLRTAVKVGGFSYSSLFLHCVQYTVMGPLKNASFFVSKSVFENIKQVVR